MKLSHLAIDACWCLACADHLLRVEEVEAISKALHAWLGIPSEDTVGRLFSNEDKLPAPKLLKDWAALCKSNQPQALLLTRSLLFVALSDGDFKEKEADLIEALRVAGKIPLDLFQNEVRTASIAIDFLKGETDATGS